MNLQEVDNQIAEVEALINHGKNTGQGAGVWMENLESELAMLRSQRQVFVMNEGTVFLTEEGETF